MTVAQGSLLGIGVLTTMEVLNERTGKTRTIRVSGRWIGWNPSRRCFHICRVQQRATGRLPPQVVALHRKFHQARPSGAFTVDVPTPAGPLREVGLLKSLIYEVPPAVRSPGKNRYQWHHAFGDTGHKGGSNYPTKVMPALRVDARGNYFIVRRPGNIFRVDTWLRG